MRSDYLDDLHLLTVIFGFLAESDLFAGCNQFREIGIEGVLRKSGKLNSLGFPVQPSGKGNTQYLGGFDRILSESLVKVSYSEKHQSIGMFSLDLLELSNQRRIRYFRCFRRRFRSVCFLLLSPFQFRVFQLLADSHTLTCPHKFGQIRIESMVREACQLDTVVYAILSARQC